mgnify:CR=1 FL=1|jgi:hypothetical protein|tara:strand:+ start:1612 stop:2133 length:522 start_codon:yes stop_codon:yes gene_type:complete
MGRASNSFTSMVGHALEINPDDKVSLPEKDLWVAVLCRAVLDACKGPPDLDMTRPANITHQNHYHYDRDQARHFFKEGGSHFRLICELAGRNPDYVQSKIRKVLLRKNGWNVDVPITSHYRQGPRRKRGKYKKKHLMGNAYYAAKAGKEMKKRNIHYQGMGRKGGRPRIYNVV